MDRENQPVKYVLFTNLEYVCINEVRVHTHALLLEECPGFLTSIDRRVRGFGMDPSWAVFDMAISSLDYTLTDMQSNAVMMTQERGNIPLFSGVFLQLADGPKLTLLVQDYKQPLDIKTFDGTWGDRVTMDKVWAHLSAQTPRYYTTPGMPRLTWGHNPSYRSR